MLVKITIIITPKVLDEAQILSVTFHVPCKRRDFNGRNPQLERLASGLKDHLRHYDMQLETLNSDQEQDSQGNYLSVTMVLHGAYAAPVVLRVADEMLKVALLFTD